MTDREAVLFANEAFYLAFQTGDFDEMDRLWATKATVSCIHPGWHHLVGRDVVMESWEGILDHPESSNMQFRDPVAILHDDFAMVICYEFLTNHAAVATNCFVREDNAWQMVHHQATVTPTTRPGPQASNTTQH